MVGLWRPPPFSATRCGRDRSHGTAWHAPLEGRFDVRPAGSSAWGPSHPPPQGQTPLHAARLKANKPSTTPQGVLSGTLSFIFNSLAPGEAFSAVVARAKALGYTEPDPRDDLSGERAAAAPACGPRDGLPPGQPFGAPSPHPPTHPKPCPPARPARQSAPHPPHRHRRRPQGRHLRARLRPVGRARRDARRVARAGGVAGRRHGRVHGAPARGARATYLLLLMIRFGSPPCHSLDGHLIRSTC